MTLAMFICNFRKASRETSNHSKVSLDNFQLFHVGEFDSLIQNEVMPIEDIFRALCCFHFDFQYVTLDRYIYIYRYIYIIRVPMRNRNNKFIRKFILR